MLRVVALSVALLASISCRGDERKTPTGGEIAGSVVTASGVVSATRPHQTARPLTVGASIHADDTVTTGPDGEVAILLAHNEVTWNLGPGQSMRIDRSRAWAAAAGSTGSVLDDREDLASAAAGRHAGREVGETSSTAQRNDEASVHAKAETTPGGTPPEMPKPELPTPRDTGAEAHDDKTNERDVIRERGGDSMKEALGDDASTTLRGGSGVGPAGTAAAGQGSGSAGIGTPPQKITSSLAMKSAVGTIAITGGRDRTEIAPQLQRVATTCKTDVAGTARLRFTIDAAGAVKNVHVSGDKALTTRVSRCLVQAAKKHLKLPAKSGAATATVDSEIHFAAP